jgi:putative hydrolase of the HAD superfamily
VNQIASSPSDRPRAVLFDLGGVVCTFSHNARLAALARAAGLPPTDVHRRLFESGFDLACDRGDYSLEQQCMEIRSRLRLTCIASELAGLWARAFSPNSDVLDIVSQVRASAVTAILTNNGPLVRMMINEYFPDIVARMDHLCFSYEVMATKPDPRAFLATLKRLGVALDSCVFVDDAESNVRGAREVGIDAIQFVGAAALANELQQRQLL